MEIRPTGVKISDIIEIGNRARKYIQETGEKALLIHVGINNVTQLDLNSLVQKLDFNQPTMQNYPGASGLVKLKNSINQYYFGNKTSDNLIHITSGGMNGLYLTLKTLNISTVYTPAFYWGTYRMLSQINRLQHSTYNDFNHLARLAVETDHAAFIINDPGNPLGEKNPDSELLEIINKLDTLGHPIILDVPYRKLFTGETDPFYQRILSFENVIVVESFSKSLGLSGYRTGFVHSVNPLFNREFGKNLLYCSNGVNVVGQEIIHLLLSSEEGKQSARNYQQETVEHICKNIQWLQENGFLANQLYKNTTPTGIYAAVNVSCDILEKHRIFGVPLSFFTLASGFENYARICVSEQHATFTSFFSPLARK